MATPLGHSLAGYAIYGLAKHGQERSRLSRLLLCLFMANAPDLDFLPGIVMGSPALYHQGITHSLGCAFLLSLVIASVSHLRNQAFGTVFSLSCIAYVSHLVIDFLSTDRRPPYGLPLLWPISGSYFISPMPIFLGVHHATFTRASTMEWLKGILHPYNLGAIGLEVVLLLPFVIFGCRQRNASLRQQAPARREGR
jgi:inner membrane protein